MRIIHGGAYLEKDPQAGNNVELPLIAKAIERQPVDVLHHQERVAGRRDSSIEESSDVRMIEGCQQLALSVEPVEEISPDQVRSHGLQGYGLIELAIGAAGEVYGSHAAPPNQ